MTSSFFMMFGSRTSRCYAFFFGQPMSGLASFPAWSPTYAPAPLICHEGEEWKRLSPTGNGPARLKIDKSILRSIFASWRVSLA